MTTTRKLAGHRSCVNAITFSRGDGRWLASGGDGMWIKYMEMSCKFLIFSVLLDLTIKLWDFHQESLIDASYSFIGHTVSLIERIEKPKH